MAEFNERAFYVVAWDIFSRLPAASLLKLKVVSKYCLEFIHDESFCKQQDRNMRSMNNDGTLFLQSSNYFYLPHADRNLIEAVTLDQDEYFCAGVHSKSIEFLRGPCQILTSSGGLLLCRTPRRFMRDRFDDPYTIINPATGMLVKVPAPIGITVERGVYNEFLKLIFDYDDNDHPFLMAIMGVDVDDDIIELDMRRKCMIYSFEHKEWRPNGSNQLIDMGDRYLSNKDHQVVLDNCVYMLSDWGCYLQRESRNYFPYIVGYNMKNEGIHFLTLPRSAHRGRNHVTCTMKIFAWDDRNKSICLVRLRKGLFKIWVLKDIASDSWVQILRKTLLDLGISDDWKLDITDFKVINGNKLVIATQYNEVYSYNLVANEATEKIATKICQGYKSPYNYLTIYSYCSTLAQIAMV